MNITLDILYFRNDNILENSYKNFHICSLEMVDDIFAILCMKSPFHYFLSNI